MTTKLRWLGHATLLIETDGTKILIDPFLNDNPSAPIKADEAEADFIVLSHGHGDHVGDVVSIAQRTKAKVIANYEIVHWLTGKQGLSADQCHAMNLGGYDFDFGRLQMTLAFHSSMLPDGSDGGCPAGLLFTFKDGKKVYDAADTALFSDMKLIGEHGLDLACLPIGDNFTMGPEDAVRAVGFLQPKKVLPIHYDTWPLIAQNAKAWAEKVKKETQAEPVVLQPGEWVES